MIVLTYDSAKRSLIFLAIYLVLTSLVIKGIGHMIEFSFLASFSVDSFSLDSLLGGFNLDFDFNSFSFEGAKTLISEKIDEMMDGILPTSLGVINVLATYGSSPSVLHASKTMMVIRI